jgi:hypothetical protein
MPAKRFALVATKDEGFFIEGRLPTLNELIFAHVRTRIRAQREASARVILFAQQARMPTYPGRVSIELVCQEPDRRRDPDGVVGGARKCVLDGLKTGGFIGGDGWMWIASPIVSHFVHDPVAGVVVRIRGVE